VVTLAVAHRVQGLLWRAIETGTAQAQGESLVRARTAFADGLRTCLLAEETAVVAIEAMAAVDVQARALKGVALAHIDYDDPARRMFGDADVLVRAQDLRAALRSLSDAGFRRSAPSHRFGWEKRFGKSVVLVSPLGAELDLHVRVTGGYFGEVVDRDRMWATSPERFTIAGRDLTALDRADRLLNACCHASLGGASGLRALHDVALLASTGDDWVSTVSRAESDGADLVVAHAIRTAWTQLGLTRDHPAALWASHHRADARQVAALEAYSTASPVQRSAEDRGVLDALSSLDKLLYLAALAFPPRATLNHRGRTYPAHLARGWRVMRRGERG
jgi:hypothetical protein